VLLQVGLLENHAHASNRLHTVACEDVFRPG
jgi:hypothetical protein